MKKLIIKSNEWYDNLPEIKRFMFFFFVIAGCNFCSLVFFGYKGYCIWLIIFMIWRVFYMMGIYKTVKKNKNGK